MVGDRRPKAPRAGTWPREGGLFIFHGSTHRGPLPGLRPGPRRPGLNIALHGLVRLPHIAAFSAGLRPEFSQTFLPGPLVELAGYGIVIGEAALGLLVLFGLWLRPALAAGLLLMVLLEFGTCLRQEWATAGLQLTYVGFYAALIATARYDAWSLDRLRGAAAVSTLVD